MIRRTSLVSAVCTLLMAIASAAAQESDPRFDSADPAKGACRKFCV
jgi:hypothetical protein